MKTEEKIAELKAARKHMEEAIKCLRRGEMPGRISNFALEPLAKALGCVSAALAEQEADGMGPNEGR